MFGAGLVFIVEQINDFINTFFCLCEFAPWKHREMLKDRASSMRYARPWICWRKIISVFAMLTMQNKG